MNTIGLKRRVPPVCHPRPSFERLQSVHDNEAILEDDLNPEDITSNHGSPRHVLSRKSSQILSRMNSTVGHPQHYVDCSPYYHHAPNNYDTGPNEWETIETRVYYNNGRESVSSSLHHHHHPSQHLNSIEIVNSDDSCCDQIWECFESILHKLRPTIKTAEVYRDTNAVFNRVDKLAGRLFPLTFLLLNFVYWSSYIYIL